MALRFYNTLSQRVEEFAPLHGNVVRIYTCGPTVYNYVHIGNLRTFTFQDIMRRWLRLRGYQLQHVMNITDVDDKIIQKAAEEKKSLAEYTQTYTQAFLEDTAALRLERPERMSKATEHIEEMVEVIRKLGEKGCTYQSGGSTYFRIASFAQYGKLSHLDFGGMRDGARVDVDKYDKDNARDFVLWKARKEGEHYWDTPLGPGRPGWHIECSTMAMEYLGETLDIHAGGVDLTFPHHENEIAQSESLTGKPFARFWLHAEHLIVEGEKMSKSLGNFFTLRELFEKGYKPEVVRYLLASVPYRSQLNFTFDGLEAAAKNVERLRNFQWRLESETFPAGRNHALAKSTSQAMVDFDEALDDDLNTAAALGAVFEHVRETNTAMDAAEFRADNIGPALELLKRFDAVFDVLQPSDQQDSVSDEEVEALIAERMAARKSKDFKRSDQIRAELLEKGIVLEDTKDGVRWKRT